MMMGSYSSTWGLFRLLLLLLLLLLGLLLLLLLLLRLHAVMVHASLATDGVSITTYTMAISHVIWGRDTIPAQIRTSLVVITITTRGMVILVMIAIRAVSSPP